MMKAADGLMSRLRSSLSHRGRRGAPLHPTAHSPRRGGPGLTARRPESGVPTVRSVHGGVQYREYSSEEQRSQRGCIAGRMQTNFGDATLRWRAQPWAARVYVSTVMAAGAMAFVALLPQT